MANVLQLMGHPQLTRENIKKALPCFGHFDLSYCYNNGFILKCPYEKLCKRDRDSAFKAQRDYLQYFQGDEEQLHRKMKHEKEVIEKRRFESLQKKLEEYGNFGDKIQIRRK